MLLAPVSTIEDRPVVGHRWPIVSSYAARVIEDDGVDELSVKGRKKKCRNITSLRMSAVPSFFRI